MVFLCVVSLPIIGYPKESVKEPPVSTTNSLWCTCYALVDEGYPVQVFPADCPIIWIFKRSRLGLFHPYVVAPDALRGFQHKEGISFDALLRKESRKSNSGFTLADECDLVADGGNGVFELLECQRSCEVHDNSPVEKMLSQGREKVWLGLIKTRVDALVGA